MLISKLLAYQILFMNKISGASRLTGFDKPTVWSLMTPLAIRTNSINLGQGFPAWEPPKFYQKFLQESLQGSNHQYTRAFGSLPLVEAIGNFHRKTYTKINPETDIVTVNGGVQGLYSCIMGIVNAGEEVIFFDPSYDCYRAQIQMAGAKAVGLPLRPKQPNSKQSIKERCKNGYVAGPEDDWEVDYEKFESLLNEKTKMFIFNTPHNPIGKVFTNDQIAKIAKILRKYPNIVVVEDNVYEGMTFDDMFQKQLPKMAFQEGMYERTLSVYSAGKIFAATGVRSGWVIGPEDLIKSVRSVHQYNVFCMYNVVENTIAKSLNQISKPEDTYMKDYASKLQKNRDILLGQLIGSKFDFDLWIPKGGYFILADISRIKVAEKYMKDEDGNPRTRDYAFCYQLAHEEGVVGIPCTPFYSKEDTNLGETYIRFAFCKQEQMLYDAGKRLK